MSKGYLSERRQCYVCCTDMRKSSACKALKMRLYSVDIRIIGRFSNLQEII